MNLTPVQISTTIAILTARYEFLLKQCMTTTGSKYAAMKTEMVTINLTIRELKNA